MKGYCRLTTQKWFQNISCIVYLTLFTYVLMHSFLYHGWTCWNGAPIYWISEETTKTIVMPMLVGAAVVLEFAWSWKRAFASLAIFLVYWLLTITRHNRVLAELVILTLLSNLSSKRAIRNTWLAIHAAYILILIAFHFLGYTVIRYTSDSKSIFGDHLGSSFGMGHPNSPAIFIMSTLLMLWYWYRPRKYWITFAIFMPGAILVFYLTLCRTVSVLMVLFPFAWMAVQAVWRKERKYSRAAAGLLPIVMIIATVLLSLYALGNEERLRDAFWMRFTELREVLAYFHLPFGSFDKAGYVVYFDNFYYWLVAYCGIIPALLAIPAFCCLNYRLIRDKEIELFAVCVLFMLYSLMENAVAYSVYFFVPFMAFTRPAINQSKETSEDAAGR